MTHEKAPELIVERHDGTLDFAIYPYIIKLFYFFYFIIYPPGLFMDLGTPGYPPPPPTHW